ncbi:hypothetical protein GPECTOR_91g547 [Gonium pectorale]|uniref:Uncharacterized protein n=1 Tax=Gonium pectorale TaxID=33097 RepID=A0A150G0I1_GONPE|nr:hypothetical protein GPECTOR_91g547 [Gonium pectorale]|eukprot:KXZ43393.1 hypothetical protein GPECTOR_91g547 [Gonium pectorale]
MKRNCIAVEADLERTVLDASTTAGASAAPVTAAAAAGAAPGGPPFWGCEAAALPPGAFHVVVSTFNAEPEQLLPWLWHLGLTNAAVYLYYRLNDSSLAALYDKSVVQLPCNMSVTALPLLPNKGREAAVFLHHMAHHYERLPKALMLVHDHGPASRHSLCGPFYRRARGYYRGLVERQDAAAAAAAGQGATKLGLFGRRGGGRFGV